MPASKRSRAVTADPPFILVRVASGASSTLAVIGVIMKQTQSCPKCRGLKLYIVDEAVQRFETDSEVKLVPRTVTAAQVEIALAGVFGESRSLQLLEGGRCEAWICAACGYTEWYTKRLGELEVLAQNSSAVRIIDRTTSAGPYRT